jgi:glycosyltransferase involved in cell wall biosynthesis
LCFAYRDKKVVSVLRFSSRRFTLKMGWVLILDDGTDKIGDLISEAKIPQIKYVEVEKKMSLGAKRNLSHTHCKGSIIVYMDDDDYYPPDRVSMRLSV